MIEASSDDMETAEDESATTKSTDKSSSSSSSSSFAPNRKMLTDDEVVSLAIMFLLAGYETTGSALSYTSYLLAMNPDKQDKLCAEIDGYFEENDEVISLNNALILIHESNVFYHRRTVCMLLLSLFSISTGSFKSPSGFTLQAHCKTLLCDRLL